MNELRVLQVAPLISPDGAFGGPVRVAVNQTAALRELGHEVTLIAGARGFDTLPQEFGGVPVRLFPAKFALPWVGYAGLIAPLSIEWFRAVGKTFDAVHVHMARDFLTLPLAKMSQAMGVKTFIQPHGMIDKSNRFLARPLDAALTRPVLRDAAGIFHLTAQEEADIRDVAGQKVRQFHLWNGVPAHPAQCKPEDVVEVICVARLHERKRPLDFVRMALQLAGKYPKVKFSLIGPDEGEGRAVRLLLAQSGNPTNIQWEGPLAPQEVLGRISRSAVYVQPSIHETFPMGVLEAMSTGTAVVLRSSCGLAPAVSEGAAGVVVDLSLEGLVKAVDNLLSDQFELARLGRNALRTARDRFSMQSVARELEEHYRRS